MFNQGRQTGRFVTVIMKATKIVEDLSGGQPISMNGGNSRHLNHRTQRSDCRREAESLLLSYHAQRQPALLQTLELIHVHFYTRPS
jgi:hypothetical protein